MKTSARQATAKSLLGLTAADLMTTAVLTIPPDMSLQEAARFLCAPPLTGAPVVDEAGRCVGVLSSSDFVTWVKQGGKPAANVEKVVCFCAPWGEMINIEDSADDEIRHYMTPRPVTVNPTTPIGELTQ